MLAASACESARILLNSQSTRFPNGLANGSGAVGRYLTDTHGLRTCAATSRPSRPCRPTTRTARATCTSTCPGGATTGSSTSPAATTSSSGAAGGCPATASAARIDKINGGGYGKALKDDYRRYYGADRGLRGPRRDDPERRQLLRDRPGRGGPSGASPSCASTGSGPSTRSARSSTMQETFRDDHRRPWAARSLDPMPGPDESYGISKGGEIIHEVGHHAHGRRARAPRC